MPGMSINTLKRDMGRGGWYWIDKTVLSAYGSMLAASGIAVYNALAIHAHSKTQVCFPSQKAIGRLIGLSRRTVARQLKRLEELSLIRIERRGINCGYLLLNPQAVPKTAKTCAKNDKQHMTPGNINNNYITRIKNNSMSDKKISASKTFKPTSKEELLAFTVAETLNDPHNLMLYLFYCKKYPESLIRAVLNEVKEMPIGDANTSPGTIFNHLIRKYVQKTPSDSHRN